MRLDEIGEFGLIERLGARLQKRPAVTLGIGDDAAILEMLHSPLVTCDALVESVHFRRDWTSARDLGWKSIAVNVSDIAAMGGRPVAAVVALAVPRDTEIEWLEELYDGFEDAAREYDFSVVGGDTTRSPHGLMISVTLIGTVLSGHQPLRRDGARVGDILIVTGDLGASAAGLQLLLHPQIEITQSLRNQLLERHHRPRARCRAIAAALGAAPVGICAALDLSDGLSGDAAHIARASGVTLEIEVARLPMSEALHDAARALGQNAQNWALCGGEDYELLLCVAPESVATVITAIENSDVAATIIGRCVPRQAAPVVLRREDGSREIAPASWTHF